MNTNVGENSSSAPRKLTVLEIREDPELIKMNKQLHELISDYDKRIQFLYKENDLTFPVFEGLGVCNI